MQLLCCEHVLASAGIDALRPSEYSAHKWLSAVITAVKDDYNADEWETYGNQLDALAAALGWERSAKDVNNTLKYDGEKDEFLAVVSKTLQLYYHGLPAKHVRSEQLIKSLFYLRHCFTVLVSFCPFFCRSWPQLVVFVHTHAGGYRRLEQFTSHAVQGTDHGRDSERIQQFLPAGEEQLRA